jgi:hypothetical protein
MYFPLIFDQDGGVRRIEAEDRGGGYTVDKSAVT